MFSVTEIFFLGFTLTTEGVKIEPSHMSIISEWPGPTTYRKIQVFLMFANFYGRFIIRFSRIISGLTGMLIGGTQVKFNKISFVFISEAIISFPNLQKTFTNAPLLWYFNPLLAIRIETDASSFAIPVILS